MLAVSKPRANRLLSVLFVVAVLRSEGLGQLFGAERTSNLLTRVLFQSGNRHAADSED